VRDPEDGRDELWGSRSINDTAPRAQAYLLSLTATGAVTRLFAFAGALFPSNGIDRGISRPQIPSDPRCNQRGYVFGVRWMSQQMIGPVQGNEALRVMRSLKDATGVIYSDDVVDG
jgi:hypothetical protein